MNKYKVHVSSEPMYNSLGHVPQKHHYEEIDAMSFSTTDGELSFYRTDEVAKYINLATYARGNWKSVRLVE